jgi:exodeoxyribonuclease V alpha subunit
VSNNDLIKIPIKYPFQHCAHAVRANPYTLAKDIHGIGFKLADTIAQKLGIARDSIMRALAGIMHALLEATFDGHCALPKEELIEQAAKLLEIDVAIVQEKVPKNGHWKNVDQIIP